MIPLSIAVTGHRDLRDEDTGRLRDDVTRLLDSLQRTYPSTPLQLLTGLAEGADQLVAECALDRGIAVIGVSPMPWADYRKDFSGAALVRAQALWTRCNQTVELPFLAHADRDVPAHRARQYELLGAWLAYHSSILIALWNGLNSEEPGGTASVVRFQLDGTSEYRNGTSSRIDNPEFGVVHWIFAPRSVKQTATSQPPSSAELDHMEISSPVPGIRTLVSAQWRRNESPQDPLIYFDEALKRVERFNRDLGEGRGEIGPFLKSSFGAKLDTVFAGAERLAGRYQKLYQRLLVALVGTGALALTLLTGFSNLASWRMLLTGYFVLFALATGLWLYGQRRKIQDRYQDYRTLGNLIRVESAWCRLGLGTRVSDEVPLKYRGALDWILQSLRALDLTPRTFQEEVASLTEEEEVLTSWVDDQLAYFRAALRTRQWKIVRTGRVVVVFLVLGFSATVAVMGLPLWSPEPFWLQTLADSIDASWILSASDVFFLCSAGLSTWLELRAFEEERSGFERMITVFSIARGRLAARKNQRNVWLELGCEAVDESVGWLLEHQKRPVKPPFEG